MSAIRTSLPTPTQPWEAAVARFVEGLSPQEVTLYQTATPENLLYNASAAQKKHAVGSRSWRLNERLSPLLEAIEDYGKALDVAANTYPLVLSPIWGSLRVILQVAAGAAKFQEQLVDMLAQIGDVLSRFRIYETLFSKHERVLSALSKAYLILLQFCVATKNLFAQANRSKLPLSIALKGIWKPHFREFDEYMRKFRAQANHVYKEAKTAHMIESVNSQEIQLRAHQLQIRNERLTKRHRVLSGLPSVDYLGKQAKLSRLRHPGTCEWLRNYPGYATWYTSLQSNCLCCYGIPGSGKSVLAASLRDVLLNEKPDGVRVLVCHYYCDYTDNPSLDVTRMLASIIKQVLEHELFSLEQFGDDFSCPYRDDRPSPTLSEGIEYLTVLLKNYSKTYLILDGIDELDVDNQTQVLTLIDTLLRETKLVVKIFLTSRPEEFRIKKSLQQHKSFNLVEENVDDDIALYVKDEIDQIHAPHPLATDPVLKRQVVNTLVASAQGLFLWAKFQLVDIKEALTKMAVCETLENLPEDLGETYSRIIRKTREGPGGQSKLDTMQGVFRWLAVARRPMRIEELEEAVSLHPSDTYLHDDRIPRAAGERLVSDCSNLAVFHEDDHTVSFAHHTVKQYLFSPQNPESPFLPPIDLSPSEDEVGDICLAYLCFSDFETQLAKAPGQLQIDVSLAEEVVWSSVPFGTRFRDALAWTRPWRNVKHHKSKPVDFAVPVFTTPTAVLTRKYTLLEYIIEHWVSHTSGLRSSSTSSWAKLRHVALHRQLAFEFRPWNEHNHRQRVEMAIRKLRRSQQQPGHHQTPLPPEYLMQISIYAWAFEHATGSLLGLVDKNIISAYFDLVQTENIPEGLESGWAFSRDHVFDVFDHFPLNNAATIPGTVPVPAPGCHEGTGWNGDKMVRLLRASIDSHDVAETEHLYTILCTELSRWLGDVIAEELAVDTAVTAMQCDDRATFELVYQEYVLDPPSVSLARSIERQNLRSCQIIKQFVSRPGANWVWTADKQWNLMFLLKIYFSRKEILLAVSETMFIYLTDIQLGQTLIVVALASRKPLSYIVRILQNLGLQTDRGVIFHPSSSRKPSAFGTLEEYQSLRKLIGVAVFSLVKDLSDAVQQFGRTMRHSPVDQHHRIATAIRSIVEIWHKYGRSFSIEILERDGIHLLKWAVAYWTSEALNDLVPIYAEHIIKPEGRHMVEDILEEYCDAPEEVLQPLRSLLG